MNRIRLLEEARYLAAIERKYDKALKIVTTLLKLDNRDIDALRLKGNILDLKSFDLKDSQYIENAKKCYEDILKIDPENTVALIDLGDYWERRELYDTALEFYENAISLLRKGHFYISYHDECEEAFYSKAELLSSIGKTEDFFRCIDEGLHLCPESELLKGLRSRIISEKKLKSSP